MEKHKDIERISNLLDQIIQNPEFHIKWLNTLSFLEYSGSKKIHKTNFGQFFTIEILQHAQEEAFHSYFFKKCIFKINPNLKNNFNYDYKNLLAGYSAYKYFQLLDLKTYEYLSKYFIKNLYYICYLYVTLLIEERASFIYPIYEERLKANHSPISIKTVILQEKNHLEHVYQKIEEVDKNFKDHLSNLFNIEINLFNSLLLSLENKVYPNY